jgi:hypothetical protein
MNRAAVLCLVTMALAPSAGMSQQTSSAAAEWGAIVKCAALKNVDARHRCTDAVMRDAGLLSDEATERRQQFGLPSTAPAAAGSAAASAPASSAASAPAGRTTAASKVKSAAPAAMTAPAGADSTPSPAAARPAAAVAKAAPAAPAAGTADGSDSKRIDVTLAHVASARDGKLTLTTSEGAVWEELESDHIQPPRQGETLTVEKTVFGGYLCRVGKHVTFRCMRKS